MNSDPICDLISDLKSDTTDIICQAIWIFLQNTIHGIPVFLIDLGPEIQRDSIFL